VFPARRVRIPGNSFLPSPIVPCGATSCSVSDRSPRRNQSARPRADPKVHSDGPFRDPHHPLGQRSVRTARRPFGPRTLRPFRAAGPPIRLPSSATGENVERSRDSGKPDRSYVFAGLKEVSRAVFADLSHVSRTDCEGRPHESRVTRPAPSNPGPVPPGRPSVGPTRRHSTSPTRRTPRELCRSFALSGFFIEVAFATPVPLGSPLSQRLLRVTVPTNPRCNR
jgi:hypothetical protein